MLEPKLILPALGTQWHGAAVTFARPAVTFRVALFTNEIPNYAAC